LTTASGRCASQGVARGGRVPHVELVAAERGHVLAVPAAQVRGHVRAEQAACPGDQPSHGAIASHQARFATYQSMVSARPRSNGTCGR